MLALCASFGAAQNLICQRFEAAEPDAELESLLYLSVGVALSDLGWSSTKAEKGADYILTIWYETRSPRGTELGLRLSLAEAKGGRGILAQSEALARLDRSLDEELSAALGRLLSEADFEEPGKQGAAAIQGLFSSELVPVEETLRTNKRLRVEALAHAGAVAYIGDFAEYAAFGASASLEAGSLFIRKSWSLSAGLRAAATKVFINEGVAGGGLYISRLGLDMGFGLGAAQKQRLSGGLSGGAAFLTVDGAEGTLTKTVPFAEAGFHAGFPLGKDFFLGGELRFAAIFDADILILGLEPSITLCKEF